jgi:DNA-binding LytR/AlgR family response regulator
VLNDKNLNFIYAYSGAEALSIIEDIGSSIAIILLDVVMEDDNAALTVAKIMRVEMEITEPHIILRTRQPGYTPEE